jgi:hypothetical protein
MVKNHKKIISVVQLSLDVLQKNYSRDNTIICHLIMKTV